MNKILINGRFTAQRVTGVQRYAIEATRALDPVLKSANQPCAVLVDTEQRAMADLSYIQNQKVGRGLHGHAWEQFGLLESRKHLLLNLCNTFPLLLRKQIVVIHDAAIYAMPQGYSRSFVFAYRTLYSFLRFKQSIRVVTDSEFSRHEISRHVGLPLDRISVVYCGADHWKEVKPEHEVIERLGLRKKAYLLAVASANPNKNLNRLIEAYRSLNVPEVPLVLVGGANKRVFATTDGIEVPGVIRAGYVKDQELAALYASARAFIFPSLYEGFGLPPLEAMTFGCPVISSREASLPEVCGEAAMYCDARDTRDIARAMTSLITDDACRERLISAGFEQIKKFTWETTAQGLLQIIRTFG